MRDPILLEQDELGRAIGSVDAPRARERFRSGLRSALLATAASETDEPVELPRRRARFAFAPRYVLTAALIVAAALGGSGVAAASSLPGDAAYAVKLALEEVELVFAGDAAGKVEVFARQSGRRLDELERVTVLRPELSPTASLSYQESVQRFQAAVDALRSAPSGEKHDRAMEVADRAAQKHIEVLESIRERHDSSDIDEALERAKELGRHTKDEDNDKKGGEKRGDGEETEDGDLLVAPESGSPANGEQGGKSNGRSDRQDSGKPDEVDDRDDD